MDAGVLQRPELLAREIREIAQEYAGRVSDHLIHFHCYGQDIVNVYYIFGLGVRRQLVVATKKGVDL